jgi:glutathionylspermidine synthase
VLWELFPDRPNLLPAYFDGPVTDYFARFVPHVIEG